VKRKGSKSRGQHPQAAKRSSSPNSSSGRRRMGLPMNGSSVSSNASPSTTHYSSNDEPGAGMGVQGRVPVGELDAGVPGLSW
jgi:hypothetical protein